jgi:hypothetical protein
LLASLFDVGKGEKEWLKITIENTKNNNIVVVFFN